MRGPIFGWPHSAKLAWVRDHRGCIQSHVDQDGGTIVFGVHGVWAWSFSLVAFSSRLCDSFFFWFTPGIGLTGRWAGTNRARGNPKKEVFTLRDGFKHVPRAITIAVRAARIRVLACRSERFPQMARACRGWSRLDGEQRDQTSWASIFGRQGPIDFLWLKRISAGNVRIHCLAERSFPTHSGI